MGKDDGTFYVLTRDEIRIWMEDEGHGRMTDKQLDLAAKRFGDAIHETGLWDTLLLVVDDVMTETEGE